MAASVRAMAGPRSLPAPVPAPPTTTGVAGLAAHLAWQIRSVDLEDGPDCMRKFVSNKWAGALLMAGCVGGRLL